MPAACSPTTTTPTAPQEASLKTSLARMVLCQKGPRSLRPPLAPSFSPPACGTGGLEQPRALGEGGAHLWAGISSGPLTFVPTALHKSLPCPDSPTPGWSQGGLESRPCRLWRGRRDERGRWSWSPPQQDGTLYICIYLGRTGWGWGADIESRWGYRVGDLGKARVLVKCQQQRASP